MIANEFSAITSVLERYRFFQECLLETVGFFNFGTAFDLKFGYIWDGDGSATVASSPRTVILRLHGMQEANILMDIPASVLDDPARASWGLTEIAIMRLVSRSDLLAKHHDAGRPLHHLAVEWESDQRIDVIFARLEVIDARA